MTESERKRSFTREDALHDITGILAEHGVTVKDYNGRAIQRRTIERFFSDTDVPPQSPLGYYIRVRVAEEDTRKVIADQLGRQRWSQKSIQSLKEALGIVRGVRKKIGEDIFRKRQDEILAALDKSLFNQSSTSARERDRRAEARRQLIAEIYEQFPQANKIKP